MIFFTFRSQERFHFGLCFTEIPNLSFVDDHCNVKIFKLFHSFSPPSTKFLQKYGEAFAFSETVVRTVLICTDYILNLFEKIFCFVKVKTYL